MMNLIINGPWSQRLNGRRECQSKNEINTMAILSRLLACSASTSLFDVHRNKCCYNKPKIFNRLCQSNLSVCAATPDLGQTAVD